MSHCLPSGRDRAPHSSSRRCSRWFQRPKAENGGQRSERSAEFIPLRRPTAHLTPLTPGVTMPRDSELCQRGNRAGVPGRVVPPLPARHSAACKTQVTDVARGHGIAASGRAARQPPGSVERRPAGAAQHPRQRPMADLLSLARRRRRRR